MTPFLRFSSINSLIFSRSTGECARGRILMGLASPVSISKGSRLAGRPIRSDTVFEILIDKLLDLFEVNWGMCTGTNIDGFSVTGVDIEGFKVGRASNPIGHRF